MARPEDRTGPAHARALEATVAAQVLAVHPALHQQVVFQAIIAEVLAAEGVAVTAVLQVVEAQYDPGRMAIDLRIG